MRQILLVEKVIFSNRDKTCESFGVVSGVLTREDGLTVELTFRGKSTEVEIFCWMEPGRFICVLKS